MDHPAGTDVCASLRLWFRPVSPLIYECRGNLRRGIRFFCWWTETNIPVLINQHDATTNYRSGRLTRPDRGEESMAYIEGKTMTEITDASVRRLAILALSGALVVLLVFLFSPKRWTTFSGVTLAAVLGFFIAFIFFKMDPHAWKRIFDGKSYEHLCELDRQVIESLARLDDSFLVLINISIELFHIEYLVISRRGIHLLAKIEEAGPMRCDNGIPMAGEHTLEKELARLWRICHFLNILLKKTFKADVLPRPVLIVSGTGTLIVENCAEASVASCENILSVIGKSTVPPLPDEVAENFAYFIKKRYVPGG